MLPERGAQGDRRFQGFAIGKALDLKKAEPLSCQPLLNHPYLFCASYLPVCLTWYNAAEAQPWTTKRR